MMQAETAAKRKRTNSDRNQEQNKEQHFRYTFNSGRLSLLKKGAVILTILMTVFFLLAGTYSCRSMGDIAVLLSWAFYLVPLAFSWDGLLHLVRQKDTVTSKERKRGAERLGQSGGIAALISAVSLFGCIYFLVTGEYESVTVELGMVIRTAAECLSALGLTFLGRYILCGMEEVFLQEED